MLHLLACVLPRLIVWSAMLCGSCFALCQNTSVSRPVMPKIGTSGSHPHLTFDVASIREYREDGSMRYVDNAPHDSVFHAEGIGLTGLILYAYGLNASQLLENMPSWASRSLYTIRAKSDRSTDEALTKLSDRDADAEKRHMIQLLLSERFHLQIHPELRTSTTYELVTTPRAAKLMTPVHGDLAKTVSTCSQHFSRLKGVEIDSKGCPFHILFDTLQQDLGTDILDRTGMTDVYAFHLTWWPTPLTPPSDVDRYPAVTDAVREQLGLELKKTKGPVTYWVVDHIERPTPN